MLDVASFWAGALTCGGVGALAACYMVCCVKETLVKAGARGPYERVAEEDDKEDDDSSVERERLLQFDGAGKSDGDGRESV